MSFALPARQVTFGRSNASQQQQPYQPQQQQQLQYQVQPQHGLALPSSNPYLLQAPAPPLPGSSSSNSSQHTQSQPAAPTSTNAVPGLPTTIVATPAPPTPAPLTLEQQHITAVEGIVPTLQNIVATVNLDCRLDLKTIALHARNAEYNPKVGIDSNLLRV